MAWLLQHVVLLNLLLLTCLDVYLFFFFFLKFVHGTTGFVSVLSEVIIVHGIHVPYQSILLKS